MAESQHLLGPAPPRRRGAAHVIARAFGALTIATVAACVAGGSSTRKRLQVPKTSSLPPSLRRPF